MVDTSTGEIKVFYGGRTPPSTPTSLVQRQQASSAFKPYVLATALEQGISLRSIYDGDSEGFRPGQPVGTTQPQLRSGRLDPVHPGLDQPACSWRSSRPAGGDRDRWPRGSRKQLEAAEIGPTSRWAPCRSPRSTRRRVRDFRQQRCMPQHLIAKVVDTETSEELRRRTPTFWSRWPGRSAQDGGDATRDATGHHRQPQRQAGRRPSHGRQDRYLNNAVSAWFVGFVPQYSLRWDCIAPTANRSCCLVTSIYGGQMPARL